MALDLDRDITINGHRFEAGKGVNTSVAVPQEDGSSKTVDYADAIKEALAAAKQAEIDQHTHHGAVPDPVNPSEATAQTPTRPLGGPNLAGEATTVTSSEVQNVSEVKDPTGEGADESSKKKDK
jgi:hypothetical protein